MLLWLLAKTANRKCGPLFDLPVRYLMIPATVRYLVLLLQSLGHYRYGLTVLVPYDCMTNDQMTVRDITALPACRNFRLYRKIQIFSFLGNFNFFYPTVLQWLAHLPYCRTYGNLDPEILDLLGTVWRYLLDETRVVLSFLPLHEPVHQSHWQLSAYFRLDPRLNYSI